MTIDILPTIAGIVGAEIPSHPIDGKDILPLLAGEPDAKSPQEAYYFYQGNTLEAMRCGRWKLHFPHKYRSLSGRPGGSGGRPVKYDEAETGMALFDLLEDMGERHNVASGRPEMVGKLAAMARAFDADLQANRRPHGVLPE